MTGSCQLHADGGDDDENSLEYTTSDEYTTGSEDGGSTGGYSASEKADSVILPFAMTTRRGVITKY